MTRARAAFTQADVRRALRAAQLAQPGVAFAIEIAGGVARIVPFIAAAPPAPEPATPLDRGLPVAP